MTRSAYLPIRPTGYKPSPAPYWNELNNAQSLVGIGSVGLLSQVPNIVDNSNSLLSKKTAQDVINNHLNRDVSDSGTGYIFTPPTGEIVNTNTPLTVPQYKTYDESFVTPNIENINTIGEGLLNTPTFKDLTSGGGLEILDEKDKLPIILKNLKTIYHGTDKDFDEFDIEQSSDGSIWFTDDKKAIENREVGASGFGRIIERQIDEGKLKLATSYQKDKFLDDELIAQGYDGVKFAKEEGYADNSYRIFFPEKLLDVSYRLESPSEDNARLYDLTQTFPDDIYSSNAIRYYGNPNNLADIESNEIIQEARGNPDMEVTIYRAVPNNADITSINEGDFVTLSKTYAEEHAAGGYGAMGNEAGKILTKKVKVKDLVTGGNDLNEFGYYPLSQ